MNYIYLSKTGTKEEGNQSRERKSEETWREGHCKHDQERGSKSGVHSLSQASHSESYRDLKHACLACMELWVYFTKYDIKNKTSQQPRNKTHKPFVFLGRK